MSVNGKKQSRTVHKFQKNAGERVHCCLTEYGGYPLVDIRVYFEDDNGNWRPTKKGISVSTDCIEDLHTGVEKIRKALRGE